MRGILLIAANSKWDVEKKINGSFSSYLEHITDEKPIVVRKCIQALASIIPHKPELIPMIKEKLLHINLLDYPDSMSPLIQKDSEKILELIKE